LFVYSAQRRIPSGTERHESGSGSDGADGVQSAERSSGSNGRLEERQRRRAHRFDDKVHAMHNIKLYTAKLFQVNFKKT